MVAGNWIMYDSAKAGLVKGTVDFDTDTLKMALVLSAYTPSLTHDEWADVSGSEHTNANGYTTGGATVTGSVTSAGSTTKLTASGNTTWTASGGALAARYAVLYKSGTANGLTNPLIGYVLLDTTPADVTAADGASLVVTLPANGFFQITGATS